MSQREDDKNIINFDNPSLVIKPEEWLVEDLQALAEDSFKNESSSGMDDDDLFKIDEQICPEDLSRSSSAVPEDESLDYLKVDHNNEEFDGIG